jgi:hypothetical protein
MQSPLRGRLRAADRLVDLTLTLSGIGKVGWPTRLGSGRFILEAVPAPSDWRPGQEFSLGAAQIPPQPTFVLDDERCELVLAASIDPSVSSRFGAISRTLRRGPRHHE